MGATQADAAGCYHCGLTIPAGANFPVVIEGAPRAMCCPGCQAVASAIVDGGLENFYRFRSQVNSKPDATSVSQARWEIYDLPEIQAEFVLDIGEGTKQANLLLEGISCAACSWLIETHLKQNPAVKSVSVNLSSHRCSLVWDSSTPLSHLLKSLAEIGYKARPATDEQQQDLLKKENRTALFRIGVAGFGMMQAMMVAVGMYTGATDFWLNFLRWLSMLVATPVVFFSAWPFFKAAWRSVQSRQLIMDVPVALAIGLAYAASVWATVTGSGEVYFESVSMFAFFLLVGRYIELRARHRNRLAFGNLAQLMPLTACSICVDGQGRESEQTVAIKTLHHGDEILVRPGETFPCDGLVLMGESAAEEALITGESRPVSKSCGDSVIAGSLNVHSPLRVRVTALGAETQLSAIERLAARAQDEKPRQVVMADKIARYFIARLLLVCVLVFGFWLWYQPGRAFWITLSVLVVTCPCALALAMPAALSAATANLRQRGFLVARGHVIDGLKGINRVIFDKTGTLTLGQLQLVKTQVLGELDGAQCQAIAAALEAGSNHPVARAFQRLSIAHPFRAEAIRQQTASGVEGEIDGRLYRLGRPSFTLGQLTLGEFEAPDRELLWVLLADQHQPLAWFGLTDEIRPDAAAAIAQLRQQGVEVELLSGDESAAVERLANTLNIEHFTAGAQPADKLQRLQQLQAQGEKVLMVGDGINDIPVLAGADISVAMASASDLTQTRADAVLLNNQLPVLAEAIGLARQTAAVIRQNLGFSLAYNLLALPLAAAGFVPPWLAALGMTASSLIVVLNALRLTRA